MNPDDVKKAAGDVTDHAQKSVRDLKSAAEASTSDLRSQTSSMAADAGGAASDLYSKAKGALHDAADRLPSASDALDGGRSAYKGGSEQVLRQVAKQPIEALLLAGAIGYLVGWASTRG